jgi:nucleotide-binding universal stress UspA family protein
MNVKNILVGIDGSAQSEVAARSGLRLARHHGAKLQLIYAGPIPDVTLSGRETYFSLATRAMQASELQKIRKYLEDLRERLIGQGVEVSHAVIDGPPVEGLVRAAKEIANSLLVVGSHGRTGLERFFLGSVAEKVTRCAPCPVLVIKNEFAEEGAKRVLVPIDFTETPEILANTLPLVLSHKSIVEFFHAWGPIDPAVYGSEWALPGGIETLRKSMVEAVTQEGKRYLGAMDPTRATVYFHAVEDYPAHGILRHLENQHHDLVVVSGHRTTCAGRWLIGSTAERVIRHAPCSALVLREVAQ